LRAIARTDGVIGVTAVPSFISTERASLAGWADHLEHVVEVAGIEHVGIGADFVHYLGEIGGTLEIEGWGPDWGARPEPFEGMLSPEDLPALTVELQRRGFSTAQLEQVYHANYFRVFERVLRASS
jgi:membrane dipeptidase